MRNSFQNVFNDLYEDSVRRKKSIKNSSPSPDHFSPNIKASQKVIVGEQRKGLYSKRKPIEDYKQLADSNAGQNLFTPMILRGPHIRGKKTSESIGDYLFEQAELKKNSSMREIPSNNSHPANILTKKKTGELISNMRTETFNVIFSLLDSDNDGIIGKGSMRDRKSVV